MTTRPEAKRKTLTLRVTLNGTDTNPFHQFGLTQNPFPQLGKMEYDRQTLHLAKLGADPIPDVAYIRKHLAGWTPEFIDLLCEKFKPGDMVRFMVEFPDPEQN